jgi:hypothetical protein
VSTRAARLLRAALALAGVLAGIWLGFGSEPRRSGVGADTAAIYALLMDSLAHLNEQPPPAIRFIRVRPDRPLQFFLSGETLREPGDHRAFLARGLEGEAPATLEAFQRALADTSPLRPLLPRRRVWLVGEPRKSDGAAPLVPRLLYAPVHGFSHVGFNADRTQAIVYATFFCGDTCGDGNYVLLERGGAGWRITDIENAWNS